MTPEREWSGLEIAIVGMAGRFPGAADIGAFWRNLVDGIESIRRLDAETLIAHGRDATEVRSPEFVAAHGVLDGYDLFDAEFFGYRPSEAEGIDPQQRLFLEVAWEALEDAGYDPARYRGLIGVFAGSSTDHYLHEQVLRNPAAMARIGVFQANYSNQLDHLAPRVSYKLNLSGPGVAVQSACSTSLVAVHLACQQLLTGACDMALAGGVSLTLPRSWGYRYEEGMIQSPDGHCRTFDADAQGCLKGDGLGIVVLKRLADALADGDHVEAVILGSAANNDGSAKVGYTAPGLNGQARLIATTHAVAGVEPDSIGYIEAHGTGTPLGDPIEIGALTRAFRRGTQRTGFCGIGSVKTNLGHLDAAAGVTGLIKAALALKHATLPASLNFRAPNPKLDLPATPFYVVDRTLPWKEGATPRRAGVSSFGIGGTNAHAVLEEAPRVSSSPVQDAGPQLLLLSARVPAALDAAAGRLADHLEAHPELPLADLAHTLALGRHAFARRRALVAESVGEAVTALRGQGTIVDQAPDTAPAVVFMFPGQGAQYVGMGRGLYARHAVFREHVDACCDVLHPLLGLDLRELLWRSGDEDAAAHRLRQTAITQPALFVIEYALARTLIALGIEPVAMVGHSLGEYVAACLAGVFTLEDALRLVTERGRLMQAQPPGAMLAVPLGAAELQPLLGEGLSLAAENAPRLCVAAGPAELIDALAATLESGLGVQATKLNTSHAFHSAMMAPAVAPFLETLAGVRRQLPTRRFVSTVTGTWADAATLADPEHWAQNIRGSVRFAAALETLFALDDVLLLEVGPGATLAGLAHKHSAKPKGLVAAGTLRPSQAKVDDNTYFLGMLGRLWCAGVEIGDAWLSPGPRRRVALPTYAFQRQRHWVDRAAAEDTAPRDGAHRAAEVAQPLFYVPAWIRSARPASTQRTERWLLVGPGDPTALFGQRLRAAGHWATLVDSAIDGAWDGASAQARTTPADHLVLVVTPAQAQAAAVGIPHVLRSLAANAPETTLRITLVTSTFCAVLGEEAVHPDLVLPIGWLQVLPTEMGGLRTRVVDLEAFDEASIDAAIAEAQSQDDAPCVAYRRGRRWRRGIAPVAWPAHSGVPSRLRPHGIYAISGGLGGMGLVLAEYLARTVQARLVLFGRSVLPERALWQRWIDEHDEREPTRQTLVRLLALEASGATMLIAHADVTDRGALAAVRDQVHARWGALQGIVHAAGIPGGGLVALQDPARAAAVLAPKVDGARALLEAFADEPLDFVVLCSSLTSFVPLPGRSDYTAANLWLDALAQSRTGSAPFTIAINWDTWREAGMALATGGEDAVGLSNAEGVEAFARALSHDEPQVLVAKRDLLAAKHTAASPRAGAAPERIATALVPPAAAAEGNASTAIERQLLALTRDLLGIEQIGIHDDFFAHGGDSVVSIQLVARARRAGLALSARQVFELKTVARMAAAAAAGSGSATPAEPLTQPHGGAPAALQLTPIQRWFFNLPLGRHGHWNLGARLQTPIDADPFQLRECLEEVLGHHDVFRSRFVMRSDRWTASVANESGLDFATVDLSRLEDDTALAAEFEALDKRAQAPFDLEYGPLVRAVHAHCGSRPGRLFLGVHHLLTDLNGAQILAEDLNDAWERRTRGGHAKALLASTPWALWTERLHAHAQRPEAIAALGHWSRLSTLALTPLPRDHVSAANRHDTTALFHLALNAKRTASLLAQVGSGTGIAGALLAALARALCEWSGGVHAWIEVEGHGRETLADDIDVSRTVGWFTAPFPLVLQGTSDVLEGARHAARALREVPLHGLSFGLLRYLHPNPAIQAEMARLQRPEVVFLYQGQRSRRGGGESVDGSALRLLSVGAAHGHADSDPRSHLFEINAWIAEGCLHVDWSYSREVHLEATVRRLAATFERALLSSSANEATTSNPEQVPLSFAQERIWFLHQLDPGAAVYNKQCVLEIDGALDESALRAALGDLIARHETLRTRFGMRDGTPVQLIDPPSAPSLQRVDLVAGDRASAERIARERALKPFDIANAAPFEAALLRHAADRHWLVLTLHHIVTDAWSLQVLVDELATLYSARHRGVPSALPALATSFANFAQWQRQWLEGPTLDTLLGYWTRQLAGLAPLNLPTDRPRPPVQGFDGARVHLRWPVSLTAALRQLGRDTGASAFMCLLALYQLLLHRYSGQTDIAVGAPAADRPRVETETLIGPLVNNLVLRTDLAGVPDFRTLLARVRETVLSANEHRDLPFEKLVGALNPARDRSRSPLFQVMFAYMNVPNAASAWDGLTVRARELDAGGAEFDLSLYAYAPGTGPDAQLSGWFEYNTALFDRSTVERLAGHLQQLTLAVCADPDRPLATLTLLTPEEHRQIIDDWNRTEVVHPPAAGLHGLFEQQVQRSPGAVAAVFDDVTLSYAELDRRANRLARHLRSLGIAPDERIAICVERSSRMLVGLLAILKCGAAYVPVDPDYPADRVAHMLEDSGARVVLTQQRCLGQIPPGHAPTICLDRDAAIFEHLDPSPLPSVTRPGHLAYVIYTSGSTGRPKGVQIEHGAVVNFVQAMIARPGLRADDTLLAVTTISFDIHVLELFAPLAVGARVVVASRETAADASLLRAVLEKGETTAMQATPSTWRMLVEAGWAGLPRLKLLCGGEALTPDLARALLPRCGELWNLYGPTEATVWATIARITDGDEPITIGRPFDNMRAYVLGLHDQPQPVGVPGELCLGGRGIARGYLNRPELSAERFFTNPFVAGERLYRSGDLARWRDDGRIEVLGRLDNQVKLRGHRVELGEIEAVCGAHPALAHCVCLVREDRPGDQRLVAYASARDGARPELAELRQFASSKLPDYMLPSALVWIDSYPLTPNGKVDRRALPAPVHGGPARKETPLTPTEAFFAGIFAEVLGIDAVGRYANFFDLGGHSLLVMKVVDRVEQRGGIRMHAGELFQQSVGQLAALHGPRLQVAEPRIASAVEQIEPLFFAGSAGALYGCHHLPDGSATDRAALLCAPLGHEYARCHRALRQLAAQLARRGFHVLRFDYSGSGDSEGDAETLRLEQCRLDIASAIAELRRHSGASHVALVGLRHGATLAFQATTSSAEVDRLVMWQPVLDGTALLDEWRTDQREFATALGYQGDEAMEQVLGAPLTRELAADIAGLEVDGAARSVRDLLIVEGADARQSARRLVAQRQAAGRPVERIGLGQSPIWRQESLEAIVPADAVQAIADWLGKRP